MRAFFLASAVKPSSEDIVARLWEGGAGADQRNGLATGQSRLGVRGSALGGDGEVGGESLSRIAFRDRPRMSSITALRSGDLLNDSSSSPDSGSLVSDLLVVLLLARVSALSLALALLSARFLFRKVAADTGCVDSTLSSKSVPRYSSRHRTALLNWSRSTSATGLSLTLYLIKPVEFVSSAVAFGRPRKSQMDEKSPSSKVESFSWLDGADGLKVGLTAARSWLPAERVLSRLMAELRSQMRGSCSSDMRAGERLELS